MFLRRPLFGDFSLHSKQARRYAFEHAPPPLFRQNNSARSRLVFFCALVVFLMVADVRFKITQPVRNVLASTLSPVQWLVMQPVVAVDWIGAHFQSLSDAQAQLQAAREALFLQSRQVSRVEQLVLENQQLHALLSLRQTQYPSAVVAHVLYDAPDPYGQKIVIDKGAMQAVQLGSPVVDAWGVLGQVTRVHAHTSEVTLLIDQDQAIPVLNTRTGERSVGYGDPHAPEGAAMSLRFIGTTADVQVGDLLTTSGVDGLYPAGLPVATIEQIDRRGNSQFAKIRCRPVAKVLAALHVMVLAPLPPSGLNTLMAPPAPSPSSPQSSQQRGRSKK